jgi:hypothetical protein
MAIDVSRPAQVRGGSGRSRVIGPGGAAYWLSAALGVAAAASSLLTFTVPAVLRGTAVMNGSARGTALLVLLAGVPALACSMLPAARGSAAAVITWLGAAGFLLYNSLMFVFAGLSGGVPGVTAAPRPPVTPRRGWHPWTLAVLDGLTGAAAVYGGAELIRDGFGMPDGWLAGTPLTGWVLPGVALLIGVAVPQLAAAALIGLAGAVAVGALEGEAAGVAG